MIETSWVFIESLQQSSKIFGNFFGKMFEKVHLAFGTILENIWEIFYKWPEIFGKSSKTPSSVHVYIINIGTQSVQELTTEHTDHSQHGCGSWFTMYSGGSRPHYKVAT